MANIPDMPVYTLRADDTAERTQIELHARRARAQVWRELGLLVPDEHQVDAWGWALELEAALTEYRDRLEQSWRRTVQRAYLEGRADGARQTVESMTGEPMIPEDPQNPDPIEEDEPSPPTTH